MSDCEHEEFRAEVNVTRLSDNDNDPRITGYSADVAIFCEANDG